MTTDRFESQNLGRNDPCPVCGRKMKHCRGHAYRKRVRVVGFLLGMGIMCVFAFFIWGQLGRGLRLSSPSEQIKQLQRVFDDHFRSCPDDQWWFTSWPPSPEDFPATVTKCDAVKEHIKILLNKYREVSPLANEIANTFRHFILTVYQQGSPQRLLVNKADQDTFFRDQPFEICLISRDQMAEQPSSHYYRRDWQLMMMAASEKPDAIFAEVLYHELGHALHHLQNRPYLGIDEETEMHWLGAEVLNAASGGKLFVHLDSVIQRQPDCSSYQTVILGLTAEDLRQYYACLGIMQPTKIVANLEGIGYLMALGQRTIRTAHPPDLWMVLERDLYRWLGRHFIGRRR